MARGGYYKRSPVYKPGSSVTCLLKRRGPFSGNGRTYPRLGLWFSWAAEKSIREGWEEHHFLDRKNPSFNFLPSLSQHTSKKGNFFPSLFSHVPFLPCYIKRGKKEFLSTSENIFRVKNRPRNSGEKRWRNNKSGTFKKVVAGLSKTQKNHVQ